MKKTIAITALLIAGLFSTGAAFSENREASAGLSGGTTETAGAKDAAPAAITEEKSGSELLNELNLCISEALERHPELKKARANSEQAWARLGQTRSAYYPQVTFSSSYSVGVQQPERDSRSRYSHGFSLRQYITDFGKTSNTLKASIESYAAAVFEQKSQEDSIICEVKKSFYECVAAKCIVEVNEDSVDKYLEHLKEAKALYHSGKAAKIDITTAEVNLTNAEYALTEAENSYQLSIVRLHNAMGCMPSSDLKFEWEGGKDESHPDYGLEELLQYAKDERPDMLASDAQLRSSKASSKAVSAEYFPTISGSAGYNWNDDHYPMDHSWQAGLSMSLTVTDGNNTAYRIRESKAKVKAAEASNERVWQNIALEVESSYITMLNNEKNLKVSDKSLKLAEENFDLANHRYYLGVGSSTEFTDAHNSLLQAKTNRIKASLNYYSSIADLEKSVGRELPKRKKIKKEEAPKPSGKLNGENSYKDYDTNKTDNKSMPQDGINKETNSTEPQK